MESLQIISADSHLVEPADLWEARLDRKFRDRAASVVWQRRKEVGSSAPSLQYPRAKVACFFANRLDLVLRRRGRQHAVRRNPADRTIRLDKRARMGLNSPREISSRGSIGSLGLAVRARHEGLRTGR
jgi:hypothetical protein